mgnify:CR=1 FL=1
MYNKKKQPKNDGMNHCAMFFKEVEEILKAFSVHIKRASCETKTTEKTINLVSLCKHTIEEHEHQICTESNITATLNCGQGYISSKIGK